MPAPIPYTHNYQDHSNQQGFQFEFFCMRCNNGYMSAYKANAVGTAAEVVRGVSSVLGGILGGASAGANALQNITGSAAHDAALKEAVEECRPFFLQCHRCSKWVCKDICWNEPAGLCVDCAPKLDQEMGAMQAQAQMQQVQQKVTEVDWAKDVNVEQRQVALCPNCHAEAAPGAKFCASCGSALSSDITCGRCGKVSAAGSKFCPECGNNLTS